MSRPATVPAIRRSTVPLPMVVTGTTMTRCMRFAGPAPGCRAAVGHALADVADGRVKPDDTSEESLSRRHIGRVQRHEVGLIRH